MTNPRIGVCSWSLRPADPRHLAEMITGLELEAVQLALRPLASDPDIWAGVSDTLADEGIRIVSGMMEMAGEDYSTLESIRRTGGVGPDETWGENRECAEKLATVAAESGIRLVTFHAGHLVEQRDDPRRAVLLDRVDALADIFADHGVRLALETGQETAETLVEVMHDLDRTDIGVNFDPANMILYGMGDPVTALDRLAPWVRQIHIKDALPTETPGTWGMEVPVGQGAVRWEDFFDVAGFIRPQVDFVIEREMGDDRQRDIERAKLVIERYAGP